MKQPEKKELVVFFVEGDTEVEFYKALVARLRARNGGRLDRKLLYKNVKGVGNYKNRAARILEKEILPKYPGYRCSVVLCYDMDVFCLQSKPPVEWAKVEERLKDLGAAQVLRLQADRSIEDWFLKDPEGLRAFLKLPKETALEGYTGLEGLRALFARGNRTYIKGGRCKGLIQALNMDAILAQIGPRLGQLCALLGLDGALSAPPPSSGGKKRSGR